VRYQSFYVPFSALRSGIGLFIAGLLCYVSLRRSRSARTHGSQRFGERASLGLMGAGIAFVVIWLAIRQTQCKIRPGLTEARIGAAPQRRRALPSDLR
jgi:hypothetical protein